VKRSSAVEGLAAALSSEKMPSLDLAFSSWLLEKMGTTQM
jgi:hypothetical protein